MTADDRATALLQALSRDELRSVQPYGIHHAKARIKLDDNESPWPLSVASHQRVLDAVAGVAPHRYPDLHASELRLALAARFGGEAGEYVVGNGSDEAISMLLSAFGKAPDGGGMARVLFPAPTFVMYGLGTRLHGMSPIAVPLDATWQLDVDAWRHTIDTENPNLIFLASPNNPTGNTFNEAALQAIVEAAPHTLVVIDEAYAAFTGRSLRHWCERWPNVAVLGTLSKIGWAGIRLGWVRLAPALAAELHKVRQPYNLNAISQTIGSLVLGELWPEVERVVASVVAERAVLAQALTSLPRLQLYPSQANFILLRVDGDAPALATALFRQGIGVRVYRQAPGEALHNHLRITVGTPAENAALLAALPEALRQLA